MGSGGAPAEGGRAKDKGRPDGHIPFIVYAYTRKAGQAEEEGTSASAGFAFVAYAAAAASARVYSLDRDRVLLSRAPPALNLSGLVCLMGAQCAEFGFLIRPSEEGRGR